MCNNPKCNCQKQITFTPKQFKLEGGSIKSKLQKSFKGTKTAWKKFLKNQQLMQEQPLLVWLLVQRLKIQKFDKQRLIY